MFSEFANKRCYIFLLEFLAKLIRIESWPKIFLYSFCGQRLSMVWGYNRNRPWPNPSQEYIWPAVNKRLALTRVFFWSDPIRFFLLKGKKLKKLWFLGKKFQTQRWLNWPDQTGAAKKWPGPRRVKSLGLDPSLRFKPRPSDLHARCY